MVVCDLELVLDIIKLNLIYSVMLGTFNLFGATASNLIIAKIILDLNGG